MATINKKYGETYIATATPNTGYRFVKWQGTGVDTTDNPASLTCFGDNTLEALFERLQYTLTVGVNPANSGSIIFDSLLQNAIIYKLTPGSAALTGDWITNNTDTSRNIYDSTTGIGLFYLNDGVTSIGGGYSTAYSPFYLKDNLLSVDISNINVTTIGKGAFCSCKNLTGPINIPEGVVSIEGDAFYECENITSLYIPSTVTNIDISWIHGTFEFCGNLDSIVVNPNNQYYYSESNCLIRTADKVLLRGSNTSIIPQGITKLSFYAFSNSSRLTSINIPASVIELYGASFSNCSGLTDITVDSNNTVYNDGGGKKCIVQGTTLIVGCKNTTIPSNITIIDTHAFSRRTGMTSISLPSTLTTIKGNAFNDCYDLTGTLTIPSNVTTLESNAFGYCNNITRVNIGNSTDGSNISKIGTRAFKSSSISTVYVYKKSGTIPTLGPDNFNKIGKTLYVYSALKSAFQSDEYWSGAFSNIRTI